MRNETTEYEYSGHHLTQSQIQTRALVANSQRTDEELAREFRKSQSVIDTNIMKALDNDLRIYDTKFRVETEVAESSPPPPAGGSSTTANDTYSSSLSSAGGTARGGSRSGLGGI